MLDLFRKKIPALVFKDAGGMIIVEENKIVVTPSGLKIKIDGKLRFVNPKIISKRVYYKNKPYAVLFYDRSGDIRGVNEISSEDVRKIKEDTGISVVPKLHVEDPVEKEWFTIEHEKKEKEWESKKHILEKVTGPLTFTIIIFAMIIVGYLVSDLAGKMIESNKVTASAIDKFGKYVEVMNQTLSEIKEILHEMKSGGKSPAPPPPI